MKILVTGCAGFIGFHISQQLMADGESVIGVDNLNDYYDVALKKNRLKILCNNPAFSFHLADISEYKKLEKVFKKNKIDKICHLAAQAGVRYSLINPFVYEKSNNLGTLNLFELARPEYFNIRTIVFASTSSVYGGNKKIPFSVNDRADYPIALYAATKKYNELMAHAYHHLYGIKMTGLRFFTVYGPWGRPDMALFIFAKAICEKKPIPLFNNGHMQRDFTYIDDIVSGVTAALNKSYDYEIFNLGNNTVVKLDYFVQCIEKELGKKARKEYLPMQPGDIESTHADIEYSRKMLGFEPKVSIEQGIKNFISWYKEYYKIVLH